MTIYVVTVGEYSGYRIVGVYSSEARARENCPVMDDPSVRDSERPQIEEWEMDTAPSAGGYEEAVPNGLMQKVFIADIDLETGNLDGDIWDTVEVQPRDWSEAVKSQRFDLKSKTLIEEIRGQSVVSAEHALKVAAEKRQAILRERAIMPQPQ